LPGSFQTFETSWSFRQLQNQRKSPRFVKVANLLTPIAEREDSQSLLLLEETSLSIQKPVSQQVYFLHRKNLDIVNNVCTQTLVDFYAAYPL